jgi:hypothetical protein
MTPSRVQQRRTKGWQKPDGAISEILGHLGRPRLSRGPVDCNNGLVQRRQSSATCMNEVPSMILR